MRAIYLAPINNLPATPATLVRDEAPQKLHQCGRVFGVLTSVHLDQRIGIIRADDRYLVRRLS